MTLPYREKITAPAAWRGPEIQNDDSWIMRIDSTMVDEIDTALAAAKDKGLVGPIGKSAFALPTLQARLAEIPDRLENGHGFALMRGLPRERYSDEDCELIYWGIGAHLGSPVSQNARGQRICHVRDVGRSLADPTARGYQTTAKLDFHCDLLPVDVLGLFCLRTARTGGASFLVSSLAVHNVLIEERPDLLDVLYEPFNVDWRGDEPEGGNPWYTNPLYSYWDGKVTSRVTTRFVLESVSRFGEALALTERQNEALDVVHEIAERPELRLAMDFQEGDMQFVNNHIILHAREEYEDFDEPERKRHLLRMWISLPAEHRRSLAPDIAARYRLVEAGGIPKRVAA